MIERHEETLKKTTRAPLVTAVPIEESKEDGGVLLAISDSRPRTQIGPQGDHVSAYALIKEAIITATTDCLIDDAIRRLVDILVDLHISHDDHLYRIISDKISAVRDGKNFIKDEEVLFLEERFNNQQPELLIKIKRAINKTNFQCLEEIALYIADAYLKSRNLVTYVSFPQEGNISPPAGEGPRVTAALKKLRATEKEVKESNKDLSIVQISETAQAMLDLFWYPPIPADVLIDLATAQGRAQWAKHSVKYNVGATPRTNDIKTLHKVIAEHIKLVFLCFKNLLNEQLIDCFIKLVGNEGKIKGVNVHWGRCDEDMPGFNKAIHEFLPKEYGEYLHPLPEGRRSESKDSTSSDSSVSDLGSDEDQKKYGTHYLAKNGSGSEKSSEGEDYQPKESQSSSASST